MLNTPLEKLTDEQLVIETLKNEDAFYYLMKRYENRLSNYISRISGLNPEEVEDILQEVFIKTFKNLNDFDKKLKFSSWIYRITRNETISHYRKHKQDKNKISLEADNDETRALIEILADKSDVHAQTQSQEIKQKVHEIIKTMPPKYSEVLILRYIEEMDYQEIGDILRKPGGSVATLINRAKEYFKKAAIKNNLHQIME